MGTRKYMRRPIDGSNERLGTRILRFRNARLSRQHRCHQRQDRLVCFPRSDSPGQHHFGLHCERNFAAQDPATRNGISRAGSHAGAHGVLYGYSTLDNRPAECGVVGGAERLLGRRSVIAAGKHQMDYIYCLAIHQRIRLTSLL